MEELFARAELGGATETLKQAAFVAAGAIAGAYVAKAVSNVTQNTMLQAGLETALGLAVAVLGQRKGLEPVVYVGIGVAAHGIGSLVSSVLPSK
ncbi:MAG: hypothetical protein QXD60_00980 [Nanopusillaceae archaeon]